MRITFKGFQKLGKSLVGIVIFSGIGASLLFYSVITELKATTADGHDQAI